MRWIPADIEVNVDRRRHSFLRAFIVRRASEGARFFSFFTLFSSCRFGTDAGGRPAAYFQ